MHMYTYMCVYAGAAVRISYKCKKNMYTYSTYSVACILCIYIYIYMGCLQNVGSRKRSKFESGRNSYSAWGPPFGEFISHMSSFLF